MNWWLIGAGVLCLLGAAVLWALMRAADAGDAMLADDPDDPYAAWRGDDPGVGVQHGRLAQDIRREMEDDEG